MVFQKASWIVPEELKDLEPINVLHKEYAPVEIQTPEALQNLHIAYESVFEVQNRENVKIRITADDYYKLYCNGCFVGMGPAQGYVFDYYWNEYDLTDYLCEGKNTLFADVYYHGLISRSFSSGDRRIGIIAEVYDGCGKVIEYTGSHWSCGQIKAYTGKQTLGYDTAFAENYDSRLEEPEYRAAVAIPESHMLHAEPTETLWIKERFPAAVSSLPDGGLFLDFGEELTGHLKLTAHGQSGQKIRILHGEETEDTPLKVRWNMRCNCICDEYWTLRDGSNCRVQYDYKAFRYVTLVPDQGVDIDSVSVIERHWKFDDDFCVLETDEEDLKKVWEICKNGVKYGAQEVFVDCPLREKGQYAGDLTVTSAAHLILTKDSTLLKKAIDNQMQSAVVCKGLLAVTPGSHMQEIADYSLQFPILALRHYDFTGDIAYLKKCLEVCEGILEHFEQFARKDGLLCGVSDKWNLVDWPANLRDGYDFPLKPRIGEDTPPHNVLNAFYIGAVLQTEKIRDILGIKKEKQSEKQSERLIRAFQKAFYEEKTGLYRDREGSAHSALHSNVLPVFYGFCPERSHSVIGDFIMEKGLCCGVYMAYFVLKALCRIGRYEDAYQLIINKSEHSWLNMVREGATTCFEAWGKDQKANTSLCHPWACAPISVLAEDIFPHTSRHGRLVYKTHIITATSRIKKEKLKTENIFR